MYLIYGQFLKKCFLRDLQNTLPVLTVSLIQELILRDALAIAIAGRDETSLAPLIKFVNTWITDPKYTSLMIDVSQVILGIFLIRNNRITF